MAELSKNKIKELYKTIFKETRQNKDIKDIIYDFAVTSSQTKKEEAKSELPSNEKVVQQINSIKQNLRLNFNDVGFFGTHIGKFIQADLPSTCSINYSPKDITEKMPYLTTDTVNWQHYDCVGLSQKQIMGQKLIDGEFINEPIHVAKTTPTKSLKTYMVFMQAVFDGKTVQENFVEYNQNLEEYFGIDIHNFRDKAFIVTQDNNNMTDTDGLLKQIYYPMGNDEYYLFTIIPSSVVMNELKQRILERKKTDENKNVLIDAVVYQIGSGKSQNISSLPVMTAGFFDKLYAKPPVIKTTGKPYKDIFMHLPVNKYQHERQKFSLYDYLDNLYKSLAGKKGSNIHERNRIRRSIHKLLSLMGDYVYMLEQSNESGWTEKTKLPKHQAVWVDYQYYKQKENIPDDWQDKVVKDILYFIGKHLDKMYQNGSQVLTSEINQEIKMISKEYI